MTKAAPPVVQREGEVPALCQDIERSLGRLSGYLNDLGQKILPAMTPEQPEEAGLGEERNHNTELSNTLVEFDMQISALIRQVVAYIDRLEL